MRVQLLNFEGGPKVLLLNFEGGPGSQCPSVPGSWGPRPTFTPCPNNSSAKSAVHQYRKSKISDIVLVILHLLLQSFPPNSLGNIKKLSGFGIRGMQLHAHASAHT